MPMKAWKHTGARRDDLRLDIETLVLVEGVEIDAVCEGSSNSSANTTCWDQEGMHTDYVQSSQNPACALGHRDGSSNVEGEG